MFPSNSSATDTSMSLKSTKSISSPTDENTSLAVSSSLPNWE